MHIISVPNVAQTLLLMFKYPQCAVNENEIPIFSAIKLPATALENFDKRIEKQSSRSNINLKFECEQGILNNAGKKVHFCESVQIFKVSPSKSNSPSENKLEPYTEPLQDPDNEDDDEDPPSPVIGSKNSPSLTPVVKSGATEMVDTPLAGSSDTKAFKCRSVLFGGDDDSIENSDHALAPEAEKSNLKEPSKLFEATSEDDSGFISFSQMTDMFKESFNSQTGESLPPNRPQNEFSLNEKVSIIDVSPQFKTETPVIENLAKDCDLTQPSNNSKNKEDDPVFIPKMIGFQTARGSSISISAEALQKSSKIILEIDSDYIIQESSKLIQESSKLTNGIDNFSRVRVPRKASKNRLGTSGSKFETSVIDLSEGTPCVGFKTGGGKSIEIWKTSLDKSKKILAELEEPADAGYKLSFGSCEFATAGGKSIKMSDEALARSAKILEGIEQDVKMENSELNENTSFFVTNVKLENAEPTLESFVSTGFKSARGNAFKVSKEAFEKSKKLLNDEDIGDCTDTIQEDINKNQAVSTTGASSSKARNILDTSPDLPTEKNPQKPSGFKPVIQKCRKTSESVENVSKSKHLNDASANKNLVKLEKTQFNTLEPVITSPCEVGKRRNTAFKSPLFADKLLRPPSDKKCEKKTHHGDDDSKSISDMSKFNWNLMSKMGRVMTIKLNCTNTLSLADLAVLNNFNENTSRTKTKQYATNSCYSKENQFVFAGSNFKFQADQFFSKRAIEKGFAFVGDNAKLILRDTGFIDVEDFHQALLTIPGNCLFIEQKNLYILKKNQANPFIYALLYLSLLGVFVPTVLGRVQKKYGVECFFSARYQIARSSW